MRKFYLLFSLCLLAKISLSQNRIQGKVVNSLDETVVSNANVFITNTSKGTRTDMEGNFMIEDAPVGNYELIISCVGFNTLTYSYTASQLPLKLLIKLDIKIQTAETAIVKAFEKDGWSKWGTTFLDSYLGTTENRKYCEILNKEVIKFRFSKKENILEAVATDMILIKNKKLGYIIKHQLEGFEINFKEKSTVNYGFPYFEEIETKLKSRIRKYERERRRAYFGSVMHLMRAIYKDAIEQEGFVIRELQKKENIEKTRVKKILQNQFKNLVPDSIKNIRHSNADGIRFKIDETDSGSYYNKIMRQPDYFDVLGRQYTAKDICFIDSSSAISKTMRFPHQLYIEYLNEKQDPLFYAYQLGKQKTAYQTTRMFFNTEIKRVDVYENGSFFNPLHVFLDGYMAWEKMADLLPLDYEINNGNN